MPLDPATLRHATQAQAAAAASTHPVVRLVAGPGSGKSQTIEQLVARLLRGGAAANRVAIVSFTNASVNDLRGRIERFCQQQGLTAGATLRVSTLHSMALGLLRQAGLLAHYAEDPKVLGDAEVKRVFDAEFRHGITYSADRAREIRDYFEALWSTSRANAPTYRIPGTPVTPAEIAAFNAFHQPTSGIYSCVLPGEIVKLCVDGINTGAIQPVQMLRLDHLIVDEYQDLNPVDLTFIDALITGGVTTFVAGDDDQSIYGFRHASPQGIQTLHSRFAGQVDSHALGHCFRCATSILDAAVALIGAYPSPNRIPKNHVSMFSNSTPPVAGIVHRWIFTNHTQEASAIAESCQNLIAAGLPAHEILILLAKADERAQLWPALRDELDRRGVRYSSPREVGFSTTDAGLLVDVFLRIVGGRDPNGVHSNILAHRLLFGMLNGVGIRKCIDLKDFVRNTPNTRYLDIFYSNPINPNLPRALTTPVTRARAATAALDAWTMADDLSTRANDIGGLIDHVMGVGKRADWDTFAATLPGGMLLEELAGYFSGSDLARQQLLLAVQARLNPQGATPNSPVAQPNAVRVMTMHGAKGLDAKIVFIPGLEQGMIPSTRAIGFPAQIEEAARLLFVSFTRARAGLIMSRSDYRTVNGRRERTTLSQFCSHTGGGFGRRISGLSTTESANLVQVATTMADLLAGRI